MTQRPAQTQPKRRRNAAATRSAIVEAATRRFACQGYQHAGVREIAADADDIARLVERFENERLDHRAALKKAARELGLSRAEAYRRLVAQRRD